MPTEPAQLANSPQTVSFEEGLALLGDIVARLESGNLGLSESIEAYERGVGLLRHLHAELARADERVSVLVRIDDEGRPVLEPLDTERNNDEIGGPSKSRRHGLRKPSRERSLPGMDDDSPEA
jgi:exodeoxyribonuclease VII small subunit